MLRSLKWVLLMGFMTNGALFAEALVSTNPKILLKSTNTWTNPQTFSSATVASINASTYNVNGTSLIQSTYSATFCNGCALYFSSGSIAANTSITISISGVSTFLIPVCSEYEGVNTAVDSVRLKSIASDRSSFVVYNADAINAKQFTCVVAGK